MAAIADSMPRILVPREVLVEWGAKWLDDVNHETGQPKRGGGQRFDRKQSVNFGFAFDEVVGHALASMLGGIPVVSPVGGSLLPPGPDCVEVGSTRVVGGIRPQNYDVAYRPDGPRIVFDSKTLNDLKSVGKNWQNMINDLATEAATVHTRFPYCLVAFMVVVPKPALGATQEATMVRTFERLGNRKNVLDETHLAEALSFVIWDPETGEIDHEVPSPNSPLRIERFSEILYPHYVERYKGLPPHD